jgi:putative ABC transport system permease protein
MLKNYITIALRNLQRYKVFSFINIIGLAVGLACCMVIALYVRHELSYDRYHTKSDRIYRVTRDWVTSDGTVSLHLGAVAPPFGPLLKNDFEEIEKVARVIQTNFLFRDGERMFNETDVYVSEPSLLDIFSVNVLKGNPETVLERPFQIMLSDEMAEKYFPGQDPVGKTIRVDNTFDVLISGMFESFPSNSHFHPKFFVSFSTLNDDNIYGRENLRTNFGNNSFATYLLLPEDYPAERLQAQFPAFLDKHLANDGPPGFVPSNSTRLYLQKVTDIHLHSNLASELEPNGSAATVYTLAAIALFILFIAIINFTNLSTALAIKRGKEVGIRKVVGVQRGALVLQFLCESAVYAFIALMLAVILVELILPPLNAFLGRDLSLAYLSQPLTIPMLLLLALVVGVLAGSYPALYLSSFKPVSVLKGNLFTNKARRGWEAISLRQVLVVAQFSISITLLICTGIMFNQLRYISNKSLGYDKEHIVTLQYPGSELGERYEAFRNELLAQPSVKSVGRSSRIPSGRLLDSQGGQLYKGDSAQPLAASLKFVTVDHEFVSTYQIDVLAGRSFSRNYGMEDTSAFIINASAVSAMGFASPQEAVGSRFQYGSRHGRIVGVLNDFNFESVHQEVLPIVFYMPRSMNFGYMAVKLSGNSLREGIAHLESTWRQFLPDRPFEYNFLDEQLAALYESEQKQGILFTIFSGLAIFIGCLGLFGLVAFTIEQRNKEIGIRKVLGASVAGIVSLFSKDFLKLVLIANLIAWPVAWWAMSKWLEDFAYSIEIGPWVFIAAAGLALSIALLTVSFQAIKAALANPIKSLRTE